MIAFWIFIFVTLLWLLGVLIFYYHALSFRYPGDIMPGMMMAYALLVIPFLVLLFGYLSELGGSF